jgi:transposase
MSQGALSVVNLLALLGIDVSLLENVVCLRIGQRCHRAAFPNTAEGRQALIQWALKLASEGLLAAVEATSNYHKELVQDFRDAGLSCLVLNPRQVRDLAKGLGIACKTDRVDAEIITQVLEVPKLRSQVLRSREHDDLRDISREIQALTDTCVDTQHRLNTPARCQIAKTADANLVKFLKQQMRELEQQWMRLLAECPELKERYEDQVSIDRIGPKTARVVVSELAGDLSTFRTKQVAHYMGVSPDTKQTGQQKPTGRIGGGNVFLRKAFFMPALTACSKDPECKDLYARMRAKGKTHKQALVAVMHKLIRRSAAVMIRRSPWRPRLDMS